MRPTGGQNLCVAHPGQPGRRPARAGTGAVHSSASTTRRGVRRVLERVVLARSARPSSIVADLLADRDHRVAEAVELGLRLALGRLDHQRARRPGTTSSARGSRSPSAAWRCPRPRCRRVFLSGAQVEDALVRDAAAARPCRAPGSARSSRLRDVVGVEDRDLRSPRVSPSAPIMRDVHPRDRQDARAAPGRGRHRADRLRRRRSATTGWPGRNGARCAATPIGPMPGPPPPCGMQKVLCRLRWQTSAPMSPGPAEADLRVHVRAVHVHLAAVLVDDRADLA